MRLKIMLSAFALVIIVASSNISGLSQAKQNSQPQKTSKARPAGKAPHEDPRFKGLSEGSAKAFVMMDRNGEFKISRESYRVFLTKVFYQIDKNSDEYLSGEEIAKADPRAIEAVDADKDGRISIPEFVDALIGAFNASDKDKDGRLTVEEYKGLLKLLGLSS